MAHSSLTALAKARPLFARVRCRCSEYFHGDALRAGLSLDHISEHSVDAALAAGFSAPPNPRLALAALAALQLTPAGRCANICGSFLGLTKMLVAGVRTVAAAARSSPGWKRDLAMMEFRELDLEEADKKGMLPEGTLEYARGVIELRVQGKLVTKTRKRWADYMCGMEDARAGKLSMRGFPYRSYDSEMTQGVNLHRALLEL